MDGAFSGTGASTQAQTVTMARMIAIKLQVRQFLLRALGGEPPDKEMMSTVEKGLDHRWIARVAVQALHDDGRVWAELALVIDWRTHELHVRAGRAEVDIDGRWPDQTAFDIYGYADLFHDYATRHRLRRDWSVRYRRGLDTRQINRRLGFESVPSRVWVSRPEAGPILPIPEIDELKVEIRLVQPE
jgi:hypothetical protein